MKEMCRCVLLALFLTLFLLVCGCGSSQVVTTSVQPSQVLEMLKSDSPSLILDVRSREEFAQGHVPGAVNIPHTELGARLSELKASPSDSIVVYCEAGGRARTAESILEQAGYSKLFDLVGHMRAWRSAGLPVEK